MDKTRSGRCVGALDELRDVKVQPWHLARWVASGVVCGRKGIYDPPQIR